MDASNPRKRPRGHPVYVWVSAEELERLKRRAEAAQLSLSAFLRNLGLGYEPRSTYDAKAILILAKTNGDQGRLGGLLKMWLSRSGEGEGPALDVRRLLQEIADTQARLDEAVRALRVPR